MQCAQCGFDNPAGALRCGKCDSSLDLAGMAATSIGTSAGMTATGAGTEGWSKPPEGARAGYGFAQALQPGSVLGGRYEILQLLGEGGMGAVYKARDRELDRVVALKVIRPELANQQEVLRRFKQELILARQVTHKNVIRIFDLGEADGIKFISMDYIEGEDLRSLLRQKGRLSPEEATSIVMQVCQALEAAHAEGVVHRDLKPQNIMLDSSGRATVMDFGIARSMELTGMTQTGALLGTPDYMSPEQAKGQEADARSDVFTLGIIFYELLTGKTPYRADTVLATLLKRTQERARPPVELDPEIPRYLSDVVVRCLEIDPRLRYQSASDIMKDLEAQRRPRTTLLQRLPRFRTVEEFPTKWIAPGLALLLLFLGVVFRQKIFGPSTQPKPGAPAASLAILPFRNASGDPGLDWLGPELAELLSTDVGQSASLQTVSSERLRQILHDLQLTPNSSLDPATLQRLADSSSAQTVVWGQYDRLGDKIRIDAKLQDSKRDRTTALKEEAPNKDAIPAAVDRLAQAIRKNLALSPSVVKELEAQAFKPSSKSLAALRGYNEGLEFLRQGSNLEAQKRFEASIKEDPEFALAYSTLAQTCANLGRDSEAEQYSRKAVDLGEKLPPPEKYRIAAGHTRIMKDNAKAIESYGNLAKAAPGDLDVQFGLARIYEDTGSFDQARDLYSKILGSDPKHLEALAGIGRVEVQSGNPQKGLDYLNRALTLTVEAGNDEEQAWIMQAMGAAYVTLNKFDEALRDYQAALDIRTRLGQKRGIADSVYAIAEVEDSQGKSALALKGYNQALELRREIGDRKGTGDVLIDLGNFYLNHGQYDQSLKMSKEALPIERDVGNQKNQALALNNIGAAFFYKGQYDDARTYYEQALQLREKLKVPGDSADSLHNLAEVSTYLGEYNQALDYYLRALELRRGAGDKRGAAIDSNSMGVLFDYQGRYGAAVASQEDALKTFRQLGERNYYLAEILNGYGHALTEAGRWDEAQKSLQEALALGRELKNQPLMAETLDFQGDVFFYRGDFKSATALYEQASEIVRRTSDQHLRLTYRFDLAKVAVKEGRSQEGIKALRALAQEGDSQGLKYLSVECSTYVAQALINLKKYSEAQQELEQVRSRSEKLGLRSQLATCHYLLATALRLTGKDAAAAGHYHEALSLLDGIRGEPGADQAIGRADLKLIYTDSNRWLQAAKG